MKTRIALLISAFIITGCATSNSGSQAVPNIDEKQQEIAVPLNEDLIVQNLVFTLAQISQTHPLKTTVSVKPARTTLASIIEGRFNDAGYGIQYVDTDEGNYYVSHAAQKSITENGTRTTYKIFIGPISIERDYSLNGQLTRPNSIVRLSGVPEQDIMLNDEIFGDEYINSQFKEVYFEKEVQTVVASVNLESVQLPIVEDKTKPESFGNLVKQNMREIMQSNYASLFDEYDVVKQSVLVFPNDSLKIGSKNKKTVSGYVSDFNPETDIMSVIGCSHGRTSRGDGGAGGNQLLALGRANRVKEALLFSGLDQTQIFEEGCWDNEYFDEVMPRRGVVLTHKRLIGQG